MRSIRAGWTLPIFLLSILLSAIPGRAQASGTRPPAAGQPPRGDVLVGGADEAQERLARDLAKKANLERQAALKADTDKLLKLATELKESVDKSNANVLSVDVVKRAEEIEKLAKSVKEKMKGPN